MLFADSSVPAVSSPAPPVLYLIRYMGGSPCGCVGGGLNVDSESAAGESRLLCAGIIRDAGQVQTAVVDALHLAEKGIKPQCSAAGNPAAVLIFPALEIFYRWHGCVSL